MPFIIGTAGHIDHGKTALVKALTGEDTDRLKEEKERGISIELGFAHLDLPDGTRAGVIDVPGHERFIRTMVAGSHGVDLVLLTVAADDGVMPQTVEHVDILHLLGVTRAVVVITKIDLAAPARVRDVQDDISRLTAGTSLEGSPVVPCSSTTGAGLDHLRSAIVDALQRIDKAPPAGYFRLPVDRVFALRGHGLIATGTALQGEVNTGDRVRGLPGGELFRVRSVQVHGQPVDAATWGQRVALNLSGAERASLDRGQTLCDERLTLTSDRFDARVEVRPAAAAAVVSHQRVRVHLGTAERLGKIVVLDGTDHVEPGHSAFCQVTFAGPLQALHGDRFIIRDETAQRTLGGGVVVHPWPQAHRRGEPDLDATLRVLHTGDPVRRAELFLDGGAEFATPLDPIVQFLNLRAGEALEHLRAAAAVRTISLDGDDLFTTARKWDALSEALVAALGEFHGAHPLEPGREMEAVREQLPMAVASKVFRAFVDALAAGRVIARDGSLLRLPDHTVSLPPEERQAADQITRLLARTPLSPPDVPQIAQETGIDRATLTQVFRVLEREGSVVRVAAGLYFLRESVDEVVRTLREEFSDRDEITPAAFRDRFNTSRKYLIPLLERLDVEGVTVRIGDRRRLRAAARSSPKTA
ncbi:MAG: selenocysteine-specific translation elongation factor [Acidobacteria bacterium]|nr:selenocysteine-specific translation elongation factor [Acidobacteriota bacterium]